MGPEQRLFFALQPAPQVGQGLQEIANRLPAHGGRLVHPQDRHITLVFLGQLGPQARACAEQAAARVQGQRFELRLDRIGYWSRPRILWAGSDHPPAPLLALVQDLQQALRACGIAPESRPYAPHVTLARKAHKLAGFPLQPPLPWPVREFVLMASAPEVPPPRYRVLARWPLGGAE